MRGSANLDHSIAPFGWGTDAELFHFLNAERALNIESLPETTQLAHYDVTSWNDISWTASGVPVHRDISPHFLTEQGITAMRAVLGRFKAMPQDKDSALMLMLWAHEVSSAQSEWKLWGVIPGTNRIDNSQNREKLRTLNLWARPRGLNRDWLQFLRESMGDSKANLPSQPSSANKTPLQIALAGDFDRVPTRILLGSLLLLLVSSIPTNSQSLDELLVTKVERLLTSYGEYKGYSDTTPRGVEARLTADRRAVFHAGVRAMFVEILQNDGTPTGYRVIDFVDAVTGIWGVRPGDGEGRHQFRLSIRWDPRIADVLVSTETSGSNSPVDAVRARPNAGSDRWRR